LLHQVSIIFKDYTRPQYNWQHLRLVILVWLTGFAPSSLQF
jgi:hypothetical protein